MSTSFVGYAIDHKIRYSATSGGIGSILLKYLFDNDVVQTGITFVYDNSSLEYKPKLIYSFKDYKITGSIYHEINLVGFIRNNLASIKGKLFLFVLPCQVKQLKSILNKNGINYFLVALTCSSQQSIDATYYLLKRLNISKTNVRELKYRGDGWPGGITIQLKDGKLIFVSNINSIWTKIFHSRLFIQKRCFRCKETISLKSDITLADPWLKEYMLTEKIGQSLILANTNEGKYWLEKAEKENKVFLKSICMKEVQKSQLSTIVRKQAYVNNKKIISIFIHLFNSSLYRFLVQNISIFFYMHCKLINIIESSLK
jgi:coenzyme F420-reducing hydrogenase beta subunit